VEPEDVVHVLRNVHAALVPRGRLLDVHPIGHDIPIRAGSRGVGFVDARAFARIVGAMDDVVAETIADGLFEEVGETCRSVVERFDDAADFIAHAEEWTNLRLPARVRRRLRETEERPVELIDAVRYRLLRKRAGSKVSRAAC
jgi:hypothetical protein